ncbi:Endocuticle structural glycoprotein SgAbd-9 [Frankliniella fusca]|uniref:Endocuticle structural glycoprotein SgAbd-9 n=1 Tax=Frankliniella fusca TaxID=407009 RepID=A0AAE1H3N3_9NEOP|nr:Endocuticle structural glycoprotein SgAbd-9 [Frankliniella fusca]
MNPLLVLLSVAVAAAQESFILDGVDHDLDYANAGAFGARHVPIVEQNFQMMQDGANRWNFESADGTGRWEEAAPAWTGAGVRGGYGYAGEDGPVAVSYVADKYGFQPTGNAIHPDIVRAVALQVAKAKEEPEGMWDERGFPVFGFHHHYSDY